MAGHETSATNFSWILYEITKNQSIQEKLFEEVRQVVGLDRDPTYEDIEKLIYTRAIIDEALRLHPPVESGFKANNEEDEIDGYYIPKGTDLIVSFYVSHVNPEYWDEPLEFKPERFDPRVTTNRKQVPFAYTPFSLGARNWFVPLIFFEKILSFFF